jgi:hypothetical protein
MCLRRFAQNILPSSRAEMRHIATHFSTKPCLPTSSVWRVATAVVSSLSPVATGFNQVDRLIPGRKEATMVIIDVPLMIEMPRSIIRDFRTACNRFGEPNSSNSHDPPVSDSAGERLLEAAGHGTTAASAPHDAAEQALTGHLVPLRPRVDLDRRRRIGPQLASVALGRWHSRSLMPSTGARVRCGS